MGKYIFLDFDGVLNTEQYQAELAIQGKYGKDMYGPLLDPCTVSQLNNIIDITGAEIIINGSVKFKLKQLTEKLSSAKPCQLTEQKTAGSRMSKKTNKNEPHTVARQT